jgi:hypothetical protein
VGNLRDYHLNVPVCDPGFLNFIELARPCKDCGGAGYADDMENYPCDRCIGIGAVPTEAGLTVLRFVRRFATAHVPATPAENEAAS